MKGTTLCFRRDINILRSFECLKLAWWKPTDQPYSHRVHTGLQMFIDYLFHKNAIVYKHSYFSKRSAESNRLKQIYLVNFINLFQCLSKNNVVIFLLFANSLAPWEELWGDQGVKSPVTKHWCTDFFRSFVRGDILHETFVVVTKENPLGMLCANHWI